ncbi:MAG: metallophosphoesterase [Prevotella sp.]
MIARIAIPVFLITIFATWYIERVVLRHLFHKLWQRILMCVPPLLMCVYTLVLAVPHDFLPYGPAVVNVYLLLLGIIVLPQWLFTICSVLGWGHCRVHHTHKNWGNLVGLLLAIIPVALTLYGSTTGFNKYVVRHEIYVSKDLPDAFDGYTVVHISDAHVGSYNNGNRTLLEKMIDTINAMKPDAIMFTGDLQNVQPEEIVPLVPLLSEMKAEDGVWSVLGNHDYAHYLHASPEKKAEAERRMMMLERKCGWNLLNNANTNIIRGRDTITVAGMENDGKSPFPAKGDLAKALYGVPKDRFVIMLEHDPSAWRRKILPHSHAQLTLSGHTHAMQFSLFGWSPASLLYEEWGGMYIEKDRAINVTVGMGGLIPFRIGASNEIVVITLKSKTKTKMKTKTESRR